MVIVPWEAQLATVLGPQIKIYSSGQQPPSGKMCAIYGRPGVGKTDLLAALADCKYTSPLIYVNIEGGAWVFSHRDDIQIIDVIQWTDFSTFLLKVNAARSLPFKGMIVDNGSELQAANVYNIVGQRGTAGINGSSMPSQQNWGASTAQMLNTFRMIHEITRRTGIHVFITAWEDARKDSVTNQIVKSGIGFTPALARSFPGIVDIVGHLTVQNDAPNYTRVLNFAANPHSDAKFRRNKGEAALKIPLTIAYRDQTPMVDVFNTLIGGEVWPASKYGKLAAQAKVDYAVNTMSADQPSEGVVETRVSELMSKSATEDS